MQYGDGKYAYAGENMQVQRNVHAHHDNANPIYKLGNIGEITNQIASSRDSSCNHDKVTKLCHVKMPKWLIYTF
jgi:hypothetical protein